MSTEQTSVTYYITVSLNNTASPAPDNNASMNFAIPEDAGITDAVALALGEAIQNAGWAPAVECSVNVGKTSAALTSYNGDLATTPPTFS